VNNVAGPVLGADDRGVLVLLSGDSMRRVDLSTGVVDRLPLEHVLGSFGGSDTVVVVGDLVAVGGVPPGLVVTDLMTGSQRQLSVDIDFLDEMHVAGGAGPNAVWLAAHEGRRGPAAIEVDLTGKVRRQIELPPQFSVNSARGDDVYLDSADGSWRYDASTGDVARLPGRLVGDQLGPMMVSCESTLECEVLVDLGDGPTPIDPLRADDVTDAFVSVAPDLSGALVHSYSDWPDPSPWIYVDLSSGTRVDLGDLKIRVVMWLPVSQWIVGLGESTASPARLIAVNVQTAEQRQLNMPPLDMVFLETILVVTPAP
jgi:hypothetical protein